MNISVVVPAVAEPITKDEAKLRSRIDGSAEDSLLDNLIASARDKAETNQNRKFMTQTLRLKLHCFHDEMALPFPPLQSVTSITYVDPNGTTQTLATSVYEVDTTSEPGMIRLAHDQSWPDIRRQRAPAIQITFVVGYASAADIPAPTKDAMLLYIDHRYRDRDGTKPIPEAFYNLLADNYWEG